jgi:hypothetical protein
MLTQEIKDDKTVIVAPGPVQLALGTQLIRNAMFGGLRYVFVVPIPSVMTPLILHKIGAAGYGTSAVFLATNGLTSLADLGLVGTLSKFAAESYAKRDLPSLSRLVNPGFGLFPLRAFVIGAALWIAGPLLASRLFRGSTAGQEKVSYDFFYTCNLSLKTDFPRTCGQFDEDFKGAAFEDIELGYRRAKQGLQILYNPAAIGYHHQFFSFSAACSKERQKNLAARVFLQTEGGKRIGAQSARKILRKGYPTTERTAKRIAAVLTRTLAPVRPLLDSNLPLPSFIYELFLWYDLNHGGFGDREVKSLHGA